MANATAEHRLAALKEPLASRVPASQGGAHELNAGESTLAYASEPLAVSKAEIGQRTTRILRAELQSAGVTGAVSESEIGEI